jgi:NADH-quinone oxidoreductase subunit J
MLAEVLTGEVIAFVIFAAIALGAALAVVSMRNLVHGALMLVIHLLAVAGLYLTLESQFLAIVQVLVYAGAIVVLFLFVIMLLGVDRDDLLIGGDRRKVAGIVAAGLVVAGAMTAAFVGPYTGEASVCGSDVRPVGAEQVCVGLEGSLAADDDAGVAFLGRRLFTRYTLVFELSAVLLTVATIGAVILARRRDLTPEDEDELPRQDAQHGTAGPDAGADVAAAPGGAPAGSAATDGEG